MFARTAQGLAADVAAMVSTTGAAFTWIAQVNDALQLVATGVAIVAGIYAIKWHRVRIKGAQEKQHDKAKQKQKSK